MRFFIAAILALLAASGTAQAAERHEQCAKGFLARGRAPEAIYLCAGPRLSCRRDWFVGGIEASSDRIRSYECKADITRMAGMVGVTPADCTDRFHAHPAAVRDRESYRCHPVDSSYEAHCARGYTPGGLMLAGKPLAASNNVGAATRRRLDKAEVSYVCIKQ